MDGAGEGVSEETPGTGTVWAVLTCFRVQQWHVLVVSFIFVQ
jgi:hypothetical protein